MATRYRYLLHSEGQCIDGKWMASYWPVQKPLSELLELKATTPSNIFETSWQGNPTAPGGSTFKREWFKSTRFDAADKGLINKCVARYVSWDTAEKTGETNAYTAHVVGELLPDYRMLIRTVWRERMEFPDLPEAIERFARLYDVDEKLKAIIVEDKSSGTAAIQTLSKSSNKRVRDLLKRSDPTGQGDKTQRAGQAAVWCKNGSVLLPAPGPACPWLVDFEDEMFTFPGSIFKDQVDALSQLVSWCENLLSAGWIARNRSTIKL
jgi:predicted phage terminase large subunit-like protein